MINNLSWKMLVCWFQVPLKKKRKRFGYWQENRLGSIISLVVLLFTYGMGWHGSFIDLYNILHSLCVLYIVLRDWMTCDLGAKSCVRGELCITLNQVQSWMTSAPHAPPTVSRELDLKLRPFALQWAASVLNCGKRIKIL